MQSMITVIIKKKKENKILSNCIKRINATSNSAAAIHAQINFPEKDELVLLDLPYPILPFQRISTG